MAVISEITNEIVLPGRQTNRAWFAPGFAAVANAGENGMPEVHVCVHQLTGMDLGIRQWLRTRDLGKTWTPPMQSATLVGRRVSDDPGVRRFSAKVESIFERGPADSPERDVFMQPGVGPYYHRATDTLLALGNTFFTRDSGDNPYQKFEEHVRGFIGNIVYAVWNNAKGDFEPWKRAD